MRLSENVQLPDWLPAETEPAETEAAWAVSREMVRLIARSVPNTGVAGSIDTREGILLHPKGKKSTGLPLASLALKKTYGQDFVEYGTFFKSHHLEGDKMVVSARGISAPVRCVWTMNSFLRNLLYNKEGLATEAFLDLRHRASARSDISWRNRTRTHPSSMSFLFLVGGAQG